METIEAARAYAAQFETLTPQAVADLAASFRPDVRFCDPFNDVVGRQKMARVFEHMFETLVEPRFSVSDIATSGRTAYLRWAFTFRLKAGGRQHRIEGLSEVTFDAFGKVAQHIDHWDAAGQVYAKLPLLGGLLRLIQARLRAR
ncbi:MAG: nuclear transport factor 2 family protein [Thalassobaculales bacterium]